MLSLYLFVLSFKYIPLYYLVFIPECAGKQHYQIFYLQHRCSLGTVRRVRTKRNNNLHSNNQYTEIKLLLSYFQNISLRLYLQGTLVPKEVINGIFPTNFS